MKRISTTEAAKILGVKPDTVRDYASRDFLWSMTRDGTNGHGKRRFFDEDEIHAFARGGIPAAKAYRESKESQVPVRKGRGKKREVTSA